MAATFDELIIIYWTDPLGRDKTTFTKEFSDFADRVLDSRYYQMRVSKYNSISVIDDISDMMRIVNDWAPKRIPFKRTDEYEIPTVFFGFQGGPGWTSPEFHEILSKTTAIPAWYPGVRVEWLPDNWFDHPGLTPPDMDVSGTLDWLELQAGSDIEPITYDFKGEHTDAPF